MSDVTIKYINLFDRVLKLGKTRYLSIGKVKYLRKCGFKPKIGIIITKNLGVSSVNRNRIRRIIKEAWRKVVSTNQVVFDLIIFPNSNIFGLKSWQIEEAILGLFEKVKYE